MKHLEYSTEEKLVTKQNGKDTITIRFTPLPQEKRAAWERSMKLLTEIILEIVKEQEKNLPQPQLFMPADLGEGRTKI